ncbi:RNA dependent RNA polymerase-domain-containing protein [Cyathus striatus]|nr:RNA dependent RNA polymerase-domain-containing protein [Cyathus striatus]
MDLRIQNLPDDVNNWDVTREFANILHSDEFYPRRPGERAINFDVKLNASSLGGVRNNGSGTLTLPTVKFGKMLLDYLGNNPLRIKKKKIKLYPAHSHPKESFAEQLAKTPYVSPDIEEERQEKIFQLDDKLRIDAVQFGVTLESRAFSIEWSQNYTNSAAWLSFEYDHKLIKLATVSIQFSNIRKIGVGYDGMPYLCFDTSTPPIMEEREFHRMLTGDNSIDNEKYIGRVGSLDSSHAEVAPYAPHLRVVLYHDPNQDVIKKFTDMCEPIAASRQCFFKNLHPLHKQLATFPWAVAFQMESFLHNGLLNTKDLRDIMPTVQDICKEKSEDYVGAFLRSYHEALDVRPVRESPKDCFTRIRKKFVYLRFHDFRCCHVTFTPTRMLLEGPYATDSNRIIRDYKGYENHFIRVEFRDEDRIQESGSILKNGFELAGRRFEFLAYSNSALREHSVWFVNPFVHPTRGEVTSEIIRNSIGNFQDLLRLPSKYAARIAQAFTATKPSVLIRKNEWEEMPDLYPPVPEGKKPEHMFTDGVGTIAKSLSNRIWEKLCENLYDKGERSIQPSAYQIRFLGYKGVVSVDEELDKRVDGILMRLRPSMRKFESHADEADIEIAMSFTNPGTCYLNRPLVMLLEDLGVRREAFEELQEIAVADARTIDESVTRFRSILETQGLGGSFRLSHLLRKVEALGLTLEGNPAKPGFDNPFFKQIRQVAMTSILREIKHRARIPIPESYLLVGVADEGPSYVREGREDVYTLPEGHIYVCIQRPSDPEPIYIEGSCSISRSPVCHPGDVQRVRAIGKPPADKLCLFAHLKNVVVLPSIGSRSLASCLSGGDLDGDQYSVIRYGPLLQKEAVDPASYESKGTLKIETDSTVNDICDFIVEYINSDVLGLLSNRLITIAGMLLDGMRDKDCVYLAELCSQAVDYPKQGIAVDLYTGRGLPRTLMRCKPDWQAAEVVSPRRTDYYESTRALGYLYRAIALEDPGSPATTATAGDSSDPISLALLDQVSFYLGDGVYPGGALAETTELFQKYSDELSYICATHTLADTPGARLLEAEVVVGTILAKCTNHRWRSNRMYRMRLHGSSLVREIQRELLADLDEATPQEVIAGLQRAWMGWDFSQRNGNRFGANSFGLVALGVIFDCLDRLK